MTYLFHGGNPSPCVHKLAHDTTLLELQDGKSFGRSCKSSSLFFFFSNVTCGALYRSIIQTKSKTNYIFKVFVLMFLI